MNDWEDTHIQWKRKSEALEKAEQVLTTGLAVVAQPAVVQKLSEQSKLELIKRSELWDMHIHMGWYSVPSKNFVENALKLITDVEAALTTYGEQTK